MINCRSRSELLQITKKKKRGIEKKVSVPELIDAGNPTRKCKVEEVYRRSDGEEEAKTLTDIQR